MYKIIIFGTTDFAQCLYHTIMQEGKDSCVAYSVHRQYIKDKTIDGIPVIPFEELDNTFNMCEYAIAIAVGYKKMNDIRLNIYSQCKQKGYHIYTFISNHSLVYSNNIGEGSLVFPGAYIGPFVTIGKGCIINMQICVSHNISINDFSYLAAGTIIGGHVKIGNHCFIGMNCTIRNGISIGNRVIIGAHSFVSKNAEDNLSFSGSPAISIDNVKSDFMIKFI